MKGKNNNPTQLHTESVAKGDENGTDCADYYHYFAGWSLPNLAT
jgi:hypothetical protein